MKALRICVYGIVQGVGFRPFVSRIADKAGILGSVANKGSYVEIFAKGFPDNLDAFLLDLKNNPPERSAVLKIDTRELQEEMIPQALAEATSFEIIESEHEEGDIFVSPDIATCDKCKQELYDSKNRRYMHPFINCTACGPRLTILDSMPYDRERTSMSEFPMCPECAYEYEHAETRRYDAQPVCCNDCGPEVYLIGRSERGRDAITAARQAILDGQIVAVKGIGGFHLCCNGYDEKAVRRLRELKKRPVKPFALMMRNYKVAKRECVIDDSLKELLDGHEKPIVLVPKKANTHIAPSVAPGNPKVGVMLPYAPVQMLLFAFDDNLSMTTDCFVMTSGNVSGAPICRTDEDALKELSGFCDIMLSHNRQIRLRADDSVMDLYLGNPYMIRRSRGYAPLPIMLDQKFKGHVLAVGGELKNTFCIGKNDLFYPSPYVGDMGDLRTVKALKESIVRMEELLEAKPSVVACDLHPMYNTGMLAKELGLPVVEVQHHYAHIVSCMAENNYDQKVIGVSFDGTGFGEDNSIWGGEFMVADYRGFERMGHIVPFNHVGGDIASKEGWRIAAAMMHELYPGYSEKLIYSIGLCDDTNSNIIKNMAEKGINTVRSTSVGRLFDSISAILGLCRSSTFEGEAATKLMFKADEYRTEVARQIYGTARDASFTSKKMDELLGATFETVLNNYKTRYPKVVKLLMEEDSDHFMIPTALLSHVIIRDYTKGVDVKQLAWVFHALLATQILEACKYMSEKTGIQTVALSGGVFQNTVLLRMCDRYLTRAGFTVLKHRLIPPNDGGIALGQAVVAMNRINKEEV